MSLCFTAFSLTASAQGAVRRPAESGAAERDRNVVDGVRRCKEDES